MGYVSGYVYETGTSNAVESVLVALELTDTFVLSDQEGYYILHYWPGKHKLIVTKDGYQSTEIDVELTSDDTAHVYIELQRP